MTTTQWERKSVNDGATWGKESSEDIMVFKCLQDRKGLWASLLVQMVKNVQCRRPGFDPWVRKIPWRGEGEVR